MVSVTTAILDIYFLKRTKFYKFIKESFGADKKLSIIDESLKFDLCKTGAPLLHLNLKMMRILFQS
jgi:hypothetical protein